MCRRANLTSRQRKVALLFPRPKGGRVCVVYCLDWIIKAKFGAFAEAAKTRKHLSLTLIATYGLAKIINRSGLAETVLTLDDLFLE